jgi:transposase
MIAANLFDEKCPCAQIARVTGVDDQTVRRWERVYRVGGREALRARKPPGGPRKLSLEQRHRLLRMLAQEPTHYGYDAHLWTTRLIARLIHATFDVQHHHDHVGVLLRELGWSVQKPARRSKERDETRIAAWRQQDWPALLKKAGRREAPSLPRTKSGS